VSKAKSALARKAREAVDPSVIATGLALVAATSGTERGLLVPGLKISDLLTVGLLVLVFVKWSGRWKIFDGLGIAVLLYAFLHVVLTMVNFSERPDLDESLLLAEMLAAPQYLLLYLVAFALGQKSSGIGIWMRPSMMIACGIAIIAFLQIMDFGPVREVLAFLTGNERIVDPYNWQVYRGSGVFPSWHALGMYLAVHIVLAAACLGRGNFPRRDQRLFVWTIVLGGIGILTTATSAPILIAALGVLLFAVSRKTAWIVLVVGGAGAIAIATTPLGATLAERLSRQASGSDSLLPQTIAFRLDVWARDFFPIIEANIWTGYGPVSDSDELFAYSESMYILLLMRGGLPLLAMFLVMLIVAYVRMNVIAKRSPCFAERAPARGARYILLALGAAMFIHPYLNDAGSTAVVFSMLGVLSGLDVKSRGVARPHQFASTAARV
jgi:hypothetical protein